MTTNFIDPNKSVSTLENVSRTFKRQTDADTDECFLHLEKQIERLRGELDQGKDSMYTSMTTLLHPPFSPSLGTPIPELNLLMQPPSTTCSLTNPLSSSHLLTYKNFLIAPLILILSPLLTIFHKQ